jgi:hypothetical protein
MLKLLVIFIFNFLSLNAQNIILSNSNQNKLYVGVDNPIEFCTNGYNCNKFTFKSSEDISIKQNGCKIYLNPKNKGTISLQIYYNNKLIDKKTFVSELLEPFIQLYAPEDNNGELIINRAVGLNLDFRQIRFDVGKVDFLCHVIIVRDKEVIYNDICKEFNFSQDFRNTLFNLKSNDIVVFYNCNITFNNDRFKLNALSYTVK